MRALSILLFCLPALGCAATLAPALQGFSGSETIVPLAEAERPAAAPEAAGSAATLADRLAVLCGPENGYALGAAGAKDDGLCTGEAAAAFFVAYAEGAALFSARVEVEQVKAEISAAQRELWAIRRTIALSPSNIASLSGRSDDRRTTRAEKDALAAEESRLAAGVVALQSALARIEAEVRAREAAGYVESAGALAAEGAAPTAPIPASY